MKRKRSLKRIEQDQKHLAKIQNIKKEFEKDGFNDQYG